MIIFSWKYMSIILFSLLNSHKKQVWDFLHEQQLYILHDLFHRLPKWTIAAEITIVLKIACVPFWHIQLSCNQLLHINRLSNNFWYLLFLYRWAVLTVVCNVVTQLINYLLLAVIGVFLWLVYLLILPLKMPKILYSPVVLVTKEWVNECVPSNVICVIFGIISSAME